VKRAVIVGAAGQDGQLLSRQLETSGYKLLRVGRRASEGIFVLDIASRDAVAKTIGEFAPDEIYYLAAFHQSSQDRERLLPSDLWDQSLTTHATGAINVLEAIRTNGLRTRFFYASSCLVFGSSAPSPQNEATPFSPETVYGITKATGVECCRFYRREHGIFAAVGILYNHESPLRSPTYLSQKIVRGALEIERGVRSELVLGDLSAIIDWGYAPDYVDAMIRILRLDAPDDYVIATGVASTAQSFVEHVFSLLHLDWREYVREDRAMLKASRGRLIGNPAKLMRDTGWRPSLSFEEMVARLVRENY
jgi:GDPmannose 4,6-dehydratase